MTDNKDNKCPVMHGALTSNSGGGTSNKDWWPNQLNLSILHQHDRKSDPMDEGITVFTGDKAVEFRGNYDTDGFIFVRQTQPLPLTILSLYPELQTND